MFVIIFLPSPPEVKNGSAVATFTLFVTSTALTAHIGFGVGGLAGLKCVHEINAAWLEGKSKCRSLLLVCDGVAAFWSW